jgi:hypothetical protein
MSLFLRILTYPYRHLFVGIICLFFASAFLLYRVVYKTSQNREHTAPTVQKGSTAPAPTTNFSQKVGGKIFDLVISNEPEPSKSGPPPIPDATRRLLITQPTPITLASAPAIRPVPPTPKPDHWLPSKRKIHCQLVNALESGVPDAPVIGIVVEDARNLDANGVSQIVIPAGVEVHGPSSGTVRDRFLCDGAWTLVWRTRDTATNSKELVIQAMALTRQVDPNTQIYGLADGSPGIRGTLIDNNNEALIRTAALGFVQGLLTRVQETTTTSNALTGQSVETPRNTLKNGLLQGAANSIDSVNQKMDQIRQAIAAEGRYVVVIPGTDFYLYTKEPIDFRKAVGPYDQQTAPSTTSQASSALAKLGGPLPN